MSISAKIIADSVSPAGVRITTFVLEYPRYIHAEVLTHRDFSRNSSSSRAIPVRKLLGEVVRNPVIPQEFGSNKPGMQAGPPLSGWRALAARMTWRAGAVFAASCAFLLNKLGVHKQYANRGLETYSRARVVLTATRFDNFFALRCHSAAQPEIRELAEKTLDALRSSTPRALAEGEWHLPFVRDEERGQYSVEHLLKFSVARCARVSYLNHDGTAPNQEADLKLYSRLVGAQPIHASSAEHQAQALADRGRRSGNFHGWLQYRKTLPGEYVSVFKEPLG